MKHPQLHFLPAKKGFGDRPVKREANLPLFVYIPGMDGTGELLQIHEAKLAANFALRCLSIPANHLGNWNILARETIELIERELNFNSQRLVYLCGESFGGCLAIKVVLTAPNLIQRLILANPASSFNRRPFLGWGVDLVQWMPPWLHGYSSVGLLPFLAELSRIEPNDRRALIKAMKLLSPQQVSRRLALLRDFEVSPAELSSIDIPTLILAGAADRLLPSVEEARRLVALLSHAKMTILPHSGHACLLENQLDLYEILARQNFLPSENYGANLAS
ncbi:alpha/beta fold hydrolase [Myxosarcina sp. GI1]|uniref:alpha/beta fold hydrolase n=1 Tax=Myxosarcina sp. GI1 TaxID=1541065 RepID=UPI00068EA49E|nr:alpha/beta hydrolase [Myxosarcina sp. GI1]